MIAALYTEDDTLVLFFCSLCRLSHTYVHLLTFLASRTSAATSPKSYSAQSTLPIRRRDADGEVFYKTAQEDIPLITVADNLVNYPLSTDCLLQVFVRVLSFTWLGFWQLKIFHSFK